MKLWLFHHMWLSYTGFSEKLSSCLDQLHSILGENLDECTAVTAVMQHNFDIERALDQILSGGMFYCVCYRSNYVQVNNCTGYNNFFTTKYLAKLIKPCWFLIFVISLFEIVFVKIFCCWCYMSFHLARETYQILFVNSKQTR